MENQKRWDRYWVFIVELSHKEDRKGKFLQAFDPSTQSGKLLDEILQEAWNSACYLVNLVRSVPKDCSGKLRYPNLDEKNAGRALLKEEIIQHQPRLVLLCGKMVSDFVLRQIAQMQSDFWTFLPSRFVAIEYPAAIAVYQKKKKADYIAKVVSLLQGKY